MDRPFSKRLLSSAQPTLQMALDEGFEPSDLCRSSAFKADTLSPQSIQRIKGRMIARPFDSSPIAQFFPEKFEYIPKQFEKKDNRPRCNQPKNKTEDS